MAHVRHSRPNDGLGTCKTFKAKWWPWLSRSGTRKADARLPEKENSNFHGARPVHPIITII
jgi:hypothetical protein